MKSVLIYGDSLVYGKIPKVSNRYEHHKTFVGVIEKNLGTEFRVISEGLRARTLDGENGFFSKRNGLEQFGPILGSHLPLDVVIIFLGVNDCNRMDTKDDSAIYGSLLKYKQEVIDWCKNLSVDKIPKILVVAPPHIRAEQLVIDEPMSKIFGPDAEGKSKRLTEIYNDFCSREDCEFFDASLYCKTSDGEGVHLDEENNFLLGQALTEKIRNVITI